MGNSSSAFEIYNNNSDRCLNSALPTQRTANRQEVLPHSLMSLRPQPEVKLPHWTTMDFIEPDFKGPATMHFSVAFQYPWNDNPELCIPPESVGGAPPKLVQNLCSVSTPIYLPIRQQITGHLNDQGLSSNLGLPEWVERQVRLDLVEAVTKLVNAKFIQHAFTFDHTYDSAVGDQGDWRANGVIENISSVFADDGLCVSLCMIYYSGAFYQVESNSKAIRDQMRTDAFKTAASLCGLSSSSPSTDSELAETLQAYGSLVFQNAFGFSYGSSEPPDSWAAEGIKMAYVKANAQLVYLPMENPGWEYLRTGIEEGLFSGLDVPIASIQRAAIDDLANTYTSILSGTSESSWSVDQLDRIYKPADPSLNPIRQKSILLSWYQYRTNSNGLKIPVVYIFVQTMFYEELPAEQRATRKLFQVLANKIRQALHNPPVADDDLLSLKEMLIEYSTIKFQSSFGFAFNGDNSNPPDRFPNGAVRGYDELLHANAAPVSVQDVEEWLDSEMFLKDTFTFPEFANNDIWYKIRDDVVGFAQNPTGDDEWFDASNSNVYLNTSSGTDIKQYSQYVYAVGAIELDGVKVARVFICYLGVYCGTLKTA